MAFQKLSTVERPSLHVSGGYWVLTTYAIDDKGVGLGGQRVELGWSHEGKNCFSLGWFLNRHLAEVALDGMETRTRTSGNMLEEIGFKVMEQTGFSIGNTIWERSMAYGERVLLVSNFGEMKLQSWIKTSDVSQKCNELANIQLFSNPPARFLGSINANESYRLALIAVFADYYQDRAAYQVLNGIG